MKIFFDQLNREVLLKSTPKRIVSLVPSQTELLFDLGLDAEVIGITKFCIHPEKWYRTKTRIGGTKTLYIDRILGLKPDVIIANKEENKLLDIQELEKIAPVWISDVRTIRQAYDMIEKIGVLVGKQLESLELVENIKVVFQKVDKPSKQQNVLYVIWNEPLMVAAGDTFINDMLVHLGFNNSATHLSRYPQLTETEFTQLDADLVFLSSEPFPFKDKHLEYFEKLCPNAICQLVDGELFSWYGSRMTKIGNLNLRF